MNKLPPKLLAPMNKYPNYTYSFTPPASLRHSYNVLKETFYLQSHPISSLLPIFFPASRSLPLGFFQVTKVFISHVLPSPFIHLLRSESLIIQDS